MTLARAICVCYGAARGHATYGLEMRTRNNKGFSGSSTSVYDSSVSQASVNMESDFTNIFLTHRKERFNKTILVIKQPRKIIKKTFVASLT